MFLVRHVVNFDLNSYFMNERKAATEINLFKNHTIDRVAKAPVLITYSSFYL